MSGVSGRDKNYYTVSKQEIVKRDGIKAIASSHLHQHKRVCDTLKVETILTSCCAGAWNATIVESFAQRKGFAIARSNVNPCFLQDRDRELLSESCTRPLLPHNICISCGWEAHHIAERKVDCRTCTRRSNCPQGLPSPRVRSEDSAPFDLGKPCRLCHATTCSPKYEGSCFQSYLKLEYNGNGSN